jgi:MFS family permease
MRAKASPSARQILVVALLSLNFGLVFFDRNALNFLMPFIQPDLGLSNTQIGLLASVLALSWALSGFVAGRVADLTGRRKLILIGCTLAFSLASFVTGLATSFVMLLVARLIMGFAEGGVMPVSQALVAASVSPAWRGLAMGVVQVFGTNLLGNFLAPILLVWLAMHGGWHHAFFLTGVPGLIMALAITLFVTDRAGNAHRPAVGAHAAVGLSAIWRHRNMALCLVLAVALVTFLIVLGAFMPLVLVHRNGLSPEGAGHVMACFGLASIALAFLVPGASDYFGRRPVAALAGLCGLALPVAVWLGLPPVWLMAGFAFGATLNGAFPIIMATVPAETVAPEVMVTALGLTMATGEIGGGVIAPLIAGHLADHVGLQAPLWIMAGASMVVAVVSLALLETAPRITEMRKNPDRAR